MSPASCSGTPSVSGSSIYYRYAWANTRYAQADGNSRLTMACRYTPPHICALQMFRHIDRMLPICPSVPCSSPLSGTRGLDPHADHQATLPRAPAGKRGAKLTVKSSVETPSSNVYINGGLSAAARLSWAPTAMHDASGAGYHHRPRKVIKGYHP